MLEFMELQEEHNRIMLASLKGEQVDFSKLRELCKRFNENCVTQNVFELEGTDQQLWESVSTYFRKLLGKS